MLETHFSNKNKKTRVSSKEKKEDTEKTEHFKY